ncbi:hypothetical protein CS542_05950 [Pedobacter sp. IW39]|nr:hypothetical protein CS542_05950 [Pedobacter sp. IW39]
MTLSEGGIAIITPDNHQILPVMALKFMTLLAQGIPYCNACLLLNPGLTVEEASDFKLCSFYCD